MNSPTVPASGELTPLVAELRGLIQSARHAASRAVNSLQVMTNFEIGRRIVEHEQQGERRAEYGKALLKALSERLTEEFGKGYSQTNLEYMRRFYLEWSHRTAQIAQKASGQLLAPDIGQKPSGLSATSGVPRAVSFPLSWSHYVLLLTLKNPGERDFYEIEAAQSGWSLPTRNIGQKASGQSRCVGCAEARSASLAHPHVLAAQDALPTSAHPTWAWAPGAHA